MQFPNLICALLMLLMCWLTPATAEDAAPKKASETISLTLYGAPETVPALEHRLLPTARECKPGNAAIFYYRAILAAYRNEKSRNALQKVDKNIEKWQKEFGNSEQIDEIKKCLAEIDSQIFDELKIAAYREEIDFSFRLQDVSGIEVFSFLLPEWRDARSLSRTLSLRSRIAVHEQRFTDSINDLRLQFRLAQIISEESSLVNALVGIAITGQACTEIEHFISKPNTPNLYWTISAIPQPLISIRKAVEFEANIPEQFFPILKNPAEQQYTQAVWTKLFLDLFLQLKALNEVGADAKAAPAGIELNEEFVEQALQEVYPNAIKALREMDYNDSMIDAMPVGQAVAIYMQRLTKIHGDNLCKVIYAPADNYLDLLAEFSNKIKQDTKENPIPNTLPALLLPAIPEVRTAEIRLQQHFVALRTFEALRMHIAATGKLPVTLADVKIVPIPNDPFTQQPLPYKLHQGTAELRLITPRIDKTYILTIGKKE